MNSTDHHWACHKLLKDCKCGNYYDGEVEYTLYTYPEHRKYNENGNNSHRAVWHCPQCGKEMIDRWSGSLDRMETHIGIGHGGCCTVYGDSFVKVKTITRKKDKNLKLRKSPEPKMSNGKYACGCCDRTLPFQVGDVVQFMYRSGGEACKGEIVGFYRASQGHITWELKGNNSFGHSNQHYRLVDKEKTDKSYRDLFA